MGGARFEDARAMLARCRDPGFTPGARDVPELVALWEHTQHPPAEPEPDEPDPRKAAQQIVRALARGDRGVARALIRGWATADGEQRAMRLRVLSRIGGRLGLPALPELLDQALRDPKPRVVREAARAVGKLEGPAASAHEAALLSVVEQAELPEQRAAVEALGRIGGARALACLQRLDPADEDLARRTAEALTLVTRRIQRDQTSQVRLDAPLPEPTRVWLCCRRGAAATVAEQARARLPGGVNLPLDPEDDTAIGLPWAGDLGDLYRVRSTTEVALVFPLPPADSLPGRIVAGLHAPPLVAALRAWTEGLVRFRLTFTAPGRRRAIVWEVARRLTERDSPLHNDSREASWTVEVDEPGARLLCRPRGADPRFAYRRRDVPAATHPTLAALLAWAGAPRPGEVVWDPFCGSGTELVECARLSPGLHLRGTDIEARAIAAARENLAAAELDAASVELRRADARSVTPRPGPVSLILSNPPMGRRAQVDDRGVRRLLHDMVAHADRVLGPGGRMVWLSPAPRTTARAGQRRGLVVEDLPAIDMGGFVSTPQVLRRPK